MVRVHLRILVGVLLLVGSLYTQAAASSCGALNEVCCGTTCNNASLGCINGTCRDCGLPDLGCCDVEPICADGFVCAMKACVDVLNGQGGGAAECDLDCLPCGGEFQRCCAKGGCDQGFVCGPLPPCETNGEGNGGGAGNTCETLSATGGAAGGVTEICLPCGGLGQPCCPGHGELLCDNENLLCGGELCEACGNIGEQCCSNDTCPNSGGLCVNGTCQPGPAPAVSTQGLILLVVTLSGIAFLGMRRMRV